MFSPCRRYSRRALVVALPAVPLIALGSSDPPAAAWLRKAVIAKDPRLARRLAEWAAKLDPSLQTVRSLLALGMTDLAKTTAQDAESSVKALSLLLIADSFPGKSVAAKLALVRESLDTAQLKRDARSQAAAAIALSQLSVEDEAREAIRFLFDRYPSAAKDVAEFAAAAGPTVPDWMLTSIAGGVELTKDGYARAFALIELAHAYLQRGNRERFKGLLASAAGAALAVGDRRQRHIAQTAIAKFAVSHGELALGVSLSSATLLAPEIAAHHARIGQRKEALGAMAQIPSDGLYVSRKGSAAIGILRDALEESRLEDADFYLGALSTDLSSDRMGMMARLVKAQVAAGLPIARQRAQDLSRLAEGTEFSMYSSPADVEQMLLVADALWQAGLYRESEVALAHSEIRLRYLSRRSVAEQALATTMVYEAVLARKGASVARPLAIKAVDLLMAAPEKSPSDRWDKARALLAGARTWQGVVVAHKAIAAQPASPASSSTQMK